MSLNIPHAYEDNKEGNVSKNKPNIIVVKDISSSKRWKINDTAVSEMMKEGLLQLNQKKDINTAWLSLVDHKDIIGIKVNSSPGKIGGTRKEVVVFVIKGLLKAKIPSENIVIWDSSLKELQTAGFVDLANRLNVRIAGSKDAGWDKSVIYNSPVVGTLITGDEEF